MAGGIVCSVLVLFYGVLSWLMVRKPSFREMRVPRNWAVPFAQLLIRTMALERLQPVLHRSRLSLAVLEGGNCSPERLLRWTAEGLGAAYAAMSAGWLLAFLADNPAAGWIGTLTAGAIPILRQRDLLRQVERRRQTILRELPVWMTRLLVLVNAGENVWRALARSVERRPDKGHPLYDELRAALAAMERGESMSLAMHEFARRCALPEVKLFAAVLLMNAWRGGEEFVPALRDLTRQMWDKRKAAARTLGEQASSRLAFPLALIFLFIIVLVGAPAMWMM